MAAPSAVTNVAATRTGTASIKLTWTNHSATGSEYEQIVIFRSTYDGSYKRVKTFNLSVGEMPPTEWTDTTSSGADRLDAPDLWWKYGVRCVNVDGYKTTYSDYVFPNRAPKKPTNVSATYTQGSGKAVISWTNPSGGYSAEMHWIQRSDNGGAWKTIARSLSGSATSYSDKTVSGNSAYRYRVLAGHYYNGDLSSAFAVSGDVYTVPAKPTELTGYRNADTSVSLSWKDNARYESAYVVERYQPATDTWDSITLSAGVTSWTDTNPATMAVGYTYKYRVKAIRGSGLTSGYSNTLELPQLQVPARPTVYEPQSGAWADRSSAVRFSWHHNSLDGSPMYGAQIQYASDFAITEQVTTITLDYPGGDGFDGTASTYLDFENDPADAFFRIRTRGAYSTEGWIGYGPWSPVAGIRLGEYPSLVLESPMEEGDSLDRLPFAFTFSYYDNSGVLQALDYSVTDESDMVLFAGTLAGDGTQSTISSMEIVIPTSDFRPVNGESYRLNIAATSTTGLGAGTSADFAVNFIPPDVPSISVEQVDGCAVRISVEQGAGGSQIQTSYLSVGRRIADGLVEMLLDDIAPEGTEFYDYLPPLDSPITYVAYAYAPEDAAYSSAEGVITVDSQGSAYINYGDGYVDYKALQMDLAWKTQTDNKRGLYEVRGRKDPVVRTTPYRKKTLSASGTLWWNEESFDALQDVSGIVYLREPKGHCIPCVMDVSANYVKGQPLVTVDLSFVQVSDE